MPKVISLYIYIFLQNHVTDFPVSKCKDKKNCLSSKEISLSSLEYEINIPEDLYLTPGSPAILTPSTTTTSINFLRNSVV